MYYSFFDILIFLMYNLEYEEIVLDVEPFGLFLTSIGAFSVNLPFVLQQKIIIYPPIQPSNLLIFTKSDQACFITSFGYFGVKISLIIYIYSFQFYSKLI